MHKTILLFLSSMFLFAMSPSAQSYPPVIESFTADASTVDLEAVESGTAEITLSWSILNLQDSDIVILDSYQIRDSIRIEDNLDASGSLTLPVINPLTFSRPAFTLRVLDETGVELQRQSLALDYATRDDVPEIRDFSVAITSLTSDQLRQGVLMGLEWDVTGRLPLSNLEFEQVFSDGTIENIELPRPNHWVSSSGSGTVQPRLDLDRPDEITLRLIVGEASNAPEREVYDTATVTLPVTITTSTTSNTTTFVPTQSPRAENVIVTTFVVEPSSADPASTVTLRWDVSGVEGGLQIFDYYENQRVDTYPFHGTDLLPASGEITYSVPDISTDEIGFSLVLPDDPATIEWDPPQLATATLTMTCPYAVVYEQVILQEEDDRCPRANAREVQAAYQNFENGHMMYFDDTGEIWVLRDDGSASYWSLNNYQSNPDPDASLSPPQGLLRPVSGFAKVWTYAYNDSPLSIGWATAPEGGYQTVRQGYSDGGYYGGYSSRFYVTFPDGSLVRISQMQGWRYVR